MIFLLSSKLFNILIFDIMKSKNFDQDPSSFPSIKEHSGSVSGNRDSNKLITVKRKKFK